MRCVPIPCKGPAREEDTYGRDFEKPATKDKGFASDPMYKKDMWGYDSYDGVNGATRRRIYRKEGIDNDY